MAGDAAAEADDVVDLRLAWSRAATGAPPPIEEARRADVAAGADTVAAGVPPRPRRRRPAQTMTLTMRTAKLWVRWRRNTSLSRAGGVSCRARAERDALRTDCPIRPRSLESLHWVPRSRRGVADGIRHVFVCCCFGRCTRNLRRANVLCLLTYLWPEHAPDASCLRGARRNRSPSRTSGQCSISIWTASRSETGQPPCAAGRAAAEGRRRSGSRTTASTAARRQQGAQARVAPRRRPGVAAARR